MAALLLIADAPLIVVVADDPPAPPVGMRAHPVAFVDVALPRHRSVPPVEIHAVAHTEGRLPGVAPLVHDLVLQDIDVVDPREIDAPALRDLLVPAAVGPPALQPARPHRAPAEPTQVQAPPP